MKFIIISNLMMTTISQIDGIILVTMDEIVWWCNINNITFKKKQKICFNF